MRLCEACEQSRAVKKATCADGAVLLLCAACASQRVVTTKSGRRTAPSGGGGSSITGKGANFKPPPPISGVDEEAGVFWRAFSALMAKSFAIQRRQIGTNVVQILIPLIIIILLFLLQLLVTSIVQASFGKFRDATPLPRTSAPALLVPLFDDARACNVSSFELLPLRLLASGLKNDVVGFKPRVDNETLDFYTSMFMRSAPPTTTTTTTTATTTAAAASSNVTAAANATSAPARPMALPAGLTTPGAGVLGNISSSPLDWQGFRARNVPAQGNRREVCNNKRLRGLPDVEVFDRLSDVEAEVIKSWFAANRSIVAALDFRRAEINRNGTSVIDFNLLYNATLTRGIDVPMLINLVKNGIYKLVTGGTSQIVFQGTSNFPTGRSIVDFDLQSQIAPILYVYVFQLLLPVFVVSLVSERENGLVQIMRQSGLPDRVYALVTYIFFLILYVLQTGIVILLAAILRFRYFIANDIGIVLLFFFVWGNCLIAVSFLFATAFGKSRTATIVMYLWVFLSGIISANLIGTFFSSLDTPDDVKNALMIVPTFVMYRGLLDLSRFTSNGGTGMTWNDLSSGAASGMVASFWGMAIMWFVCLVLSWYLGNVLPSAAGGAPRPLLFFLPKALRDVLRSRRNVSDDVERDIRAAMAKEADDVAIERLRTERHARNDNAEHYLVREIVSSELRAQANRDDASHKAGVPPAVRTYNLRKTFKNPDGKQFVAVNGCSMSLFHGQCLGLVGPNGAGKTTFISMLSGQIRPDSGEAFLEDASVTFDMEKIYRRMGVCPQSDVLWPDLTAAETLRFYATLKGLTGAQRVAHVDYWLDQVDLVAAKDRVTSTYSGGMRRRLCVACSLIGGPHTVFLDEPSASLDPASRHRLWDVILANKATTTMLLTTHSMSEASALCDRVGVFVDGKLRAIGTPDFLQSRYGAHVKVALTTLADRKSVARGEAVLRQVQPEARLVSSLAGTTNFELDREHIKFSALFRQLGQAVARNDILDFGIANTTLEEVFVRILFVNKDDGAGAGKKLSKRSATVDDADDFADDGVPMSNVVARTMRRDNSRRDSTAFKTVDVNDDDGKSEVGENELDVLRAQLARTKSLKKLDGAAFAAAAAAAPLSARRSVPAYPGDDPDELIVTDRRSLRRAPSQRATIRVTDDIVLDLSLSSNSDDGQYPFHVAEEV